MQNMTTKEKACIRELYELVNQVVENALKHDLSLLRNRGGASGCDMYQGLPPICRIRDDIFNRYEDIFFIKYTSVRILNQRLSNPFTENQLKNCGMNLVMFQ